MHGRSPRLPAALVLVAALALPALAQTDLPTPRYYVEDAANVINVNHERALNGVLQELEQKTGAQYIILTVPTTGGMAIEEFSMALAEKWKLGQKGKDNGFLFTLALKERRYRFEVGYGLEGYITDQYCGQIGRDVLRPYLRQRNYSEGIYQANLRVIQKIAGAAGVTLTGMPRLPRGPVGNRSDRGRRIGVLCVTVPCLLLMMFFLFGAMGQRMGWWFFLPMMFGGFGGHGGFGRSGSYGGGSFGGSFGGFGGGFGGFGGGGGGGFGGGGASGGW